MHSRLKLSQADQDKAIEYFTEPIDLMEPKEKKTKEQRRQEAIAKKNVRLS